MIQKIKLMGEMKMNRKYLALILAVVMVFVFAGCAPAAPVAPPTMEVAPAAPEAPATEAVDVEALVKTYFAEMPDNTYKIDNKEFVEKVKTGGDFVVLDIRSAKDYEAGHIKGAINAPWGPAIAENLNKIPQDKEVFLYCYTGQTAGQAVVTMNLAGINARSVHLGWNMGVSKVEGFEAVTETTANAFGADVYPVDAAVQEAMAAYYAGLADVKETKFANYKVSEDDLKAMIDASEDFYLLDVRKAEDYVKGHIKGAVNVPFGKGQIEGLTDVPKDKKVVVYCYTGQTAGQTTAGMKLLGYDAVSLNGGAGKEMNQPMGWTNKGFELVTE